MRPVDIAKQLTARRRSPYTEAHWVPRSAEPASGRSSVPQEHAIVRQDVGARDWAAIDPMRVRVSKGVRCRERVPVAFSRLVLVGNYPGGGESTSVRSGRFAVRASPEDRPLRRLPIHGIASPAHQRASSPSLLRRARPGTGAFQPLTSSATPKLLATARASR